MKVQASSAQTTPTVKSAMLSAIDARRVGLSTGRAGPLGRHATHFSRVLKGPN